jgi:hypothetical protein
MPVNLPNPGTYLSQLGSDCANFRDALQRLLNDAAYLSAIGGVATLEAAPFNIDAADAQAIMNTVGIVTPGNGVVQSIQAFIASTEFLWGGQ